MVGIYVGGGELLNVHCEVSKSCGFMSKWLEFTKCPPRSVETVINVSIKMVGIYVEEVGICYMSTLKNKFDTHSTP